MDDQRDYAEEAYNRAEMEREGTAERVEEVSRPDQCYAPWSRHRHIAASATHTLCHRPIDRNRLQIDATDIGCTSCWDQFNASLTAERTTLTITNALVLAVEKYGEYRHDAGRARGEQAPAQCRLFLEYAEEAHREVLQLIRELAARVPDATK